MAQGLRDVVEFGDSAGFSGGGLVFGEYFEVSAAEKTSGCFRCGGAREFHGAGNFGTRARSVHPHVAEEESI